MTVRIESFAAHNGDVDLHYLAAGSGPPIVFLHGFPDHSWGWRRQFEALSTRYRVIAPDLRDFGKSGAPRGVAHYGLSHLVNDVLAVLASEKLQRASIVGHDWGATIAWWLAIRSPKTVRHLIVLSTPHPRNYLRAIADPVNAEKVKYIRRFQQRDAADAVNIDELTSWVVDVKERAELRATMDRTRVEAMLNYYRANIPLGHVPEVGPLPLVKAPTLVMFGSDDPYVPAGAYDGTFKEVEHTSGLIALHGAGHFIQQEAGNFVSSQIEAWVARSPSEHRGSVVG